MNLAKLRIFLAVFLIGCASTIHQKEVFSTSPSYSTNGLRDSSIVSFDSFGAIIDSHGRDRYNSLIDSYGSFFTPALKHDDGIFPQSNGTYHIDNLHLEQAVQMNQWLKSGKAPQKNLIQRII